MKTLKIATSLVMFYVFTSFAQVPQGFTYQSLLRDATGNPVASTAIPSVRFKIFRGVDSIYVETQTGSTNEFGIIALTVGQGTPVLGTFSGINWSTGTFSLKVEINFGSGYENMGTNTLYTVPFSMVSGKAYAGVSPFTVDALTGQPRPKPAILLRDSVGNTLVKIHSDKISNTFIGLDAGKLNIPNPIDSSGMWNSFIGAWAGDSNTLGKFNVAVGTEALFTNSIGIENTAVGVKALFSNKDGSDNTAVGRNALNSNTSGNSNTAVGVRALSDVTTGDGNTAMGRSALSNNKGSYNTAYGRSALFTNVSGTSNVAVGIRALYRDSLNSYNVGIGDSALFHNGQGGSAGQGLTNTAVGSKALYSNTLGSSNVGIGGRALNACTTGSTNTAVGKNTLFLVTTASGNTAVGNVAGDGFAHGNNNTFIGNSTDASVGSLTNSTAIGNGATFAASNNMVFGNSSVVGWGFGTSQFSTGSPATVKAMVIGTGPSNGNGAALTLGGTWIASDYNYTSAQTRYASFAPHAFNAATPNTSVLNTPGSGSYTYFVNGTAGNLQDALTPVRLPDGATITELRAWLYDNDATYGNSVFLQSLTMGAIAPTLLATIQTTGPGASAAVQNLSSALTQGVDNSTNSYYIQWQGLGSNNNIRLYGVRITYSVIKPN